MVNSFAELIDPITPEVFLDEYYGQKPLHIPGDPEKFASVMSWSALKPNPGDQRFLDSGKN